MPDNDILQMILSETRCIRDDMQRMSDKIDAGLGALRTDLTAQQERIAKAEQKIEDMHRERERLIATTESKAAELYNDIKMTKIILNDSIKGHEDFHKATCKKNHTADMSIIKIWILSAVVIFLLGISSFFVTKYISDIDRTITTEAK